MRRRGAGSSGPPWRSCRVTRWLRREPAVYLAGGAVRSAPGSGRRHDRSNEPVRDEGVGVARQDAIGIAFSDRVEERLCLDVIGIAPRLDRALARAVVE